MFSFPLSTRHISWQGQGAVFGLMPHFGIDALGLCAGASAVWVAKSAPYEACLQVLTDNREEVIGAQAIMTAGATMFDIAAALEDAAAHAGTGNPVRTREYGEGIASHVILDLVGVQTIAHYIIAFFHTGGNAGTGGHAIGVSFETADTGYIMDPNYGVAHYSRRSALCNDLHGLLASYVFPGGHITKSILLEYDAFALFGGF